MAEITSYTNLSEQAGIINNCANAMQGYLNEISQRIAVLDRGDGVWDGDAANRAKVEFQRLSAQFTQFSDAVKSCANYIQNTAAATYESADKALQDAAQNMGL